MHRPLQRLIPFLILVLGLSPLGCRYVGYKTLPESGASLEGTVTYGKEKLQAAFIIVQGSSGAATGNIGEDGHYKIENVPLGEVSIAVNTEAAKGQLMGQFMAQSLNKEKGGKAPPRIIDVPAKYADPNKSGIKTTINKGPNTFDIVIPR
jgi:hypothetical protein